MTILRGNRRIEPGNSHQVVDLDPFRNRVLASRARAVGDRRYAGVGVETVAIIDERLGARGNGWPPEVA